MTTLYIRNGELNMALLAEEGVSHLVFTRQNLGRQKHEGHVYVRQFYAATGIKPKIMVIGPGGASNYFLDDKIDSPRSVFPVWSAKNDKLSDLVKLCADPVGDNEELCFSNTTPRMIRPVFGQEHRVVIYNPVLILSDLWRSVKRIRADYPDVKFHLNGCQPFHFLFNNEFDSVDYDPASSRGSEIALPGGNLFRISCDPVFNLEKWQDWINLLGFSIDDVLRDIPTRIKFNIRSAMWAKSHYIDNFRWVKNVEDRNALADPSEEEYVPRNSRTIVSRRKRYSTKLAEKILCNRCSIAPGCKLFRSGQVCGLAESSMTDLTQFFQSRSADKIIDGLAEITKMQARRLQTASAAEELSGEFDPEVTKMQNSLFKNGVSLAKLINPELSGPGTRVQVNVGVNGNAEAVSLASPKQLMASVFRELESQGIPRDQITPEMVKGIISGMVHGSPMKSITAAAVMNDDELAAARLRAELAESAKAIEGEVLPLPIHLPL